MFEAKLVTTIRPSQRAKTLLEVRARRRDSLGREARAVGVRRVAAQQQHALARRARPAARRRRAAPSTGRLVELVVAGDQHGAELGRRARRRTRRGSSASCGRSSTSNGPSSSCSPGVDVARRSTSLSRCSSSLERAIAIVSGPPKTGGCRSPQLAQDPRQRAEVVLVAVGDDDALDVVDALAQVGEVGQHEVDADHLGGREAQADVDDEDPVRRTRRPSCSCRSRPARRAGGRAACRPLSARPSRAGRGARAPARTRRARARRPRRAAGAARRRQSPSSSSAALTRDRVRGHAERLVDVAAAPASISARRSGSSTMRRISSPTTWLATRMPPAPPMSSDARPACRRCRRRARGRRSARGCRRWPA